MRIRWVAALAPVAAWFVIAFFGLAVQVGHAQGPDNRDGLAAGAAAADIESALVDIIARAEKSVVAIAHAPPTNERAAISGDLQADIVLRQLWSETTRQPPQPTGTGVIIDASGLILTQYLLVDLDEAHTITTIDGKTYPATILGADPRSGLAVLKIDASSLPAIRLGDADRLRKGQFVAAIGNPYAIASDGQPSASWGIVSNLSRKLGADVDLGDPDFPQSTLHHFGTLIQTDAKLTFGTGGGALVNLRGEMVGLNTSAAAIAGHEQPAGYAIPMNSIFRRIIDLLKEGREVEYGLLGIQFNQQLPPEMPDGLQGVVVSGVPEGGPAARAGLRVRDVVTHVGGQPVRDADRLQLIVGATPPESNTTVRFYREGQVQTANIVLAKYPTAGRKVYTPPPAWRGIHVDFDTAVDSTQMGADAVASTRDPAGCVVVRDVEQGSSAWKAGIRPGMYISHVGEQRVHSPGEFRAAVQANDGVVGIRLTESLEGGEPNAPANKREVPVAM
jgi:serine protease Do